LITKQIKITIANAAAGNPAQEEADEI